MNLVQYQQRRINQLEQQVERQSRLIDFYRTEFSGRLKPRHSYRTARSKTLGSIDPFVWLEWLLNKGFDLLAKAMEWIINAGFVALGQLINRLLKYLERKIPQWGGALRKAKVHKEVS